MEPGSRAGRRGHGPVLGCQAGARCSRLYAREPTTLLQPRRQADHRRRGDGPRRSHGGSRETIPVPSGTDVSTRTVPRRSSSCRLSVQFGPNPDYSTGELVLWDLDAGRELRKLDGAPSHTTWPSVRRPLAHGPPCTRGRRDALPERDDRAGRFDVGAGAHTEGPTSLRSNAVFTKDSNSIVVGKNDRVAVLEIPSGRELKIYGPLPYQPLAVAVSPDGRWVAATPSDDAGRRRSTSGTRQVGPRSRSSPSSGGGRHDPFVQPRRPSTRICGFDAKVKIWDTETGQELLTLSGHKSWIWKMHFSPDGNRILSCGRDRTLRIWDGRPLGADVAH